MGTGNVRFGSRGVSTPQGGEAGPTQTTKSPFQLGDRFGGSASPAITSGAAPASFGGRTHNVTTPAEAQKLLERTEAMGAFEGNVTRPKTPIRQSLANVMQNLSVAA